MSSDGAHEVAGKEHTRRRVDRFGPQHGRNANAATRAARRALRAPRPTKSNGRPVGDRHVVAAVGHSMPLTKRNRARAGTCHEQLRGAAYSQRRCSQRASQKGERLTLTASRRRSCRPAVIGPGPSTMLSLSSTIFSRPSPLPSSLTSSFLYLAFVPLFLSCEGDRDARIANPVTNARRRMPAPTGGFHAPPGLLRKGVARARSLTRSDDRKRQSPHVVVQCNPPRHVDVTVLSTRRRRPRYY